MYAAQASYSRLISLATTRSEYIAAMRLQGGTGGWKGGYLEACARVTVIGACVYEDRVAQQY